MENINDLIWIPESEDDDNDLNDFGGGEGGGMQDYCMVNSCQNQGAGNVYACHKDAPSGTGSCSSY